MTRYKPFREIFFLEKGFFYFLLSSFVEKLSNFISFSEIFTSNSIWIRIRNDFFPDPDPELFPLQFSVWEALLSKGVKKMQARLETTMRSFPNSLEADQERQDLKRKRSTHEVRQPYQCPYGRIPMLKEVWHEIYEVRFFFLNWFPPGPLSIPLGPLRIFSLGVLYRGLGIRKYCTEAFFYIKKFKNFSYKILSCSIFCLLRLRTCFSSLKDHEL